MSFDAFLTTLQSQAGLSSTEIEAARRELVEDGEPNALRLAALLVEKKLLSESRAHELLLEAAGGAAARAGVKLEGRVIGNYRVLERVSEGGMGAIHLAEHVKLGRRAALKVIREDRGAEPELVKRFENEARVLAKIQHPNVVTVFDFGRDGAVWFILMEYVDGVSLGKMLDDLGHLAPREAARIVRDACLGLEAIHEAGLVHRDLKPDNILVGGDGRVKIADFGVSADTSNSLGVTASGAVVGTPLYMAPEQAR
ncbi:MAG TPA: serine/threonine-protein kinase, partial [Planctomycetota bacterium]|nr:serine/threonine-protein kinase [Planctomycetota bacterium]